MYVCRWCGGRGGGGWDQYVIHMFGAFGGGGGGGVYDTFPFPTGDGISKDINVKRCLSSLMRRRYFQGDQFRHTREGWAVLISYII